MPFIFARYLLLSEPMLPRANGGRSLLSLMVRQLPYFIHHVMVLMLSVGGLVMSHHLLANDIRANQQNAPEVKPNHSVVTAPAAISGIKSETPPAMTYRVVAGDTLAGIAQRVLGDQAAWRWLWQNNRELKSPDHLVPGMSIRIPQKNPSYALINRDLSAKVIRMQPRIRPQDLPTITPSPVRTMSPQFLLASAAKSDRFPNLITVEEIQDSPKISQLFGARLLTDVGEQALATWHRKKKSVHNFEEGQLFAVYRQKNNFTATKIDKNLGEIIHQVGHAKIAKIVGKNIYLTITKLLQPIKINDFILPIDRIRKSYPSQMTAKRLSLDKKVVTSPNQPEVVSIIGGQTAAGLDQLVVINIGLENNMNYQQLVDLIDPHFIKRNHNEKYKTIEGSMIGQAELVYLSTTSSIAKINTAKREIRIGDKVLLMGSNFNE